MSPELGNIFIRVEVNLKTKCSPNTTDQPEILKPLRLETAVTQGNQLQRIPHIINQKAAIVTWKLARQSTTSRTNTKKATEILSISSPNFSKLSHFALIASTTRVNLARAGPQLRNRAMRNGLLSQTTNPGMQPPGFPTDVIALK